MAQPESSFIQAVRNLMASIREMLAASQLLRSRIESNDEVQRVMQNKLARLETSQVELDRRLTKMENERHRPRPVGDS